MKKVLHGNIGKKRSDETKRKIRLWHLGKKASTETKMKLSIALLGNKRTLGHKLTEAHKEKLRIASTGRKQSLASIEKMRKSKIGKKRTFTPEWIAKLTASRNKNGNPAKRPEVRDKIRLGKLGEKNPNWKGGITPINKIIRASAEYRLWRVAVFERDDYTCIWCGDKNGNGKAVILHADHIKPFAYFPELRFAIDNGRTLCKQCHITTETYGNRK